MSDRVEIKEQSIAIELKVLTLSKKIASQIDWEFEWTMRNDELQKLELLGNIADGALERHAMRASLYLRPDGSLLFVGQHSKPQGPRIFLV